MSDSKILDKYIDLDKSCLSDTERNRLWTCYVDIKTHLV